MERARKITVEISPELLDKAQRASGAGITKTVRIGLQLVAASQTYAKLRGFRGRFASPGLHRLETRPMIAADPRRQ